MITLVRNGGPRARENNGTERDIEGVGWDMSISLKLFFSFRGSPDVRMVPFTR